MLVAWSAVDAVNADLRCWHVTESAITEVTNVVLNSTDDQGLCGISIEASTGKWCVVYGGKSDGSETYLTSINLYMKCSTDSGSTWGPETKLTTAAADITWLCTIPRILSQVALPMPVVYHSDIALDELLINVGIVQPRARLVIGI